MTSWIFVVLNSSSILNFQNDKMSREKKSHVMLSASKEKSPLGRFIYFSRTGFIITYDNNSTSICIPMFILVSISNVLLLISLIFMSFYLFWVYKTFDLIKLIFSHVFILIFSYYIILKLINTYIFLILSDFKII